jgi:hypothetical protein
VARNYPRQLPRINYWFVSEKKPICSKNVCNLLSPKKIVILAINMEGNRANMLLLWELLRFWPSGSINSVTTSEYVSDNY